MEPIGADPPAVRIADEGTWVHPPLGKWIIALLGVGPIGQRSIGWRFPSAVFGIAGVGLLYLLALRLWRSVWWAGFAALLLALDGLHIVQSRIAMLDIFLTTFVTAAVLFLVLDRERMRDTPVGPARWPRVERLFGSPYRLVGRRLPGMRGRHEMVRARSRCRSRQALRHLGVHRSTGGAIARRSPTVGTLVASFVLVPLARLPAELRRVLLSARVRDPRLLPLQSAMLRYQEAHDVVQPENSLPWTWPLLLHPFRYFEVARDGASSVVIGAREPGPVVGLPRCCCPSRSSRSSAGRRGRTRSSSEATPRCSCPGSWSGERSSSGTCSRPSRSCVSPCRRRFGGCRRSSGRNAAIVFAGRDDRRGAAVPAGVDGVAGRRLLDPSDRAGCPTGRCERDRWTSEGAARGPPLLSTRASCG